MPSLPPRADIDQLRRIARDRLRAARGGDADAIAWITAVGDELSLAHAQLRLARDHGFPSWPSMHLEVARRRLLDGLDPHALARFVARFPSSATDAVVQWADHPKGASPLGYLAMARYDTSSGRWRDVTGTGDAARVLIANGARVDGEPDDPETPLITAASYGDVDVAAVLIAAGADLDALARHDAGGVPGGSALLHAAVFGTTAVLDVLVAAGARVRSLEEAAAAGDVDGWLTADADVQTCVRALVMAADHERVAVIERLVAGGTPVDQADEAFGRHPLRLAAANGRPGAVTALLRLGADPTRRDARGATPLDHCRHGRERTFDSTGHDAVEALLVEATERAVRSNTTARGSSGRENDRG